MSKYDYIASKADLEAFANRHGLRPDWHEPDEQGVTARVAGITLDNAFGARGHDIEADFGDASRFSDLWEGHELRVVLRVEGQDGGTEEEAVINLASLLGWACQ